VQALESIINELSSETILDQAE